MSYLLQMTLSVTSIWRLSHLNVHSDSLFYKCAPPGACPQNKCWKHLNDFNWKTCSTSSYTVKYQHVAGVTQEVCVLKRFISTGCILRFISWLHSCWVMFITVQYLHLLFTARSRLQVVKVHWTARSPSSCSDQSRPQNPTWAWKLFNLAFPSSFH